MENSETFARWFLIIFERFLDSPVPFRNNTNPKPQITIGLFSVLFALLIRPLICHQRCCCCFLVLWLLISGQLSCRRRHNGRKKHGILISPRLPLSRNRIAGKTTNHRSPGSFSFPCAPVSRLMATEGERWDTHRSISGDCFPGLQTPEHGVPACVVLPTVAASVFHAPCNALRKVAKSLRSLYLTFSVKNSIVSAAKRTILHSMHACLCGCGNVFLANGQLFPHKAKGQSSATRVCVNGGACVWRWKTLPFDSRFDSFCKLPLPAANRVLLDARIGGRLDLPGTGLCGAYHQPRLSHTNHVGK